MAEAAHFEREPGSFRDRNGTVLYRGDRVLRSLSPAALRNWRQLQETDFFWKHTSLGRIVGTREVEEDLPPEGVAALLEHERIPFVSYPYEWPFGMLKDAALLHLELMRDALAEGMILKDATPYNVQWRGAQPVFIDIPSFEPLPAGAPWVGYRQFCELFLYPLMLAAYRGIDYRPWLRGRIEGIPAEEMRRLLATRDLARPGVLLHVVAQAALQRRYASGGKNMRRTLAEAGFDKAMIVANVEKLSRLVARLSLKRDRTAWSDYDRSHSYDVADAERKAGFVRSAAASQHWRLAWDLGCNTGGYSRVLAEHADCVVAMDGDAAALEALYEREKAGRSGEVLSLVVNLADAPPNQGWLGRERKGLVERGRPELTLCLALVHHVAITNNVPLAAFVGWLAELRTALVIEFVSRDDEMVRALLANREDQYDDYTEAAFRRLLEERFHIEAEEPLKGGRRHLFFVRPR